MRQVFQEVAQAVEDKSGDRPIVDLVLCGHAHCLEYLQTKNTGYADSYINWLVCGGSGHSLRRQRQEGNILTEVRNDQTIAVAESLRFIGRNGHGSHKKRPYSFLRIDVHDVTPPEFLVRPYVAERYQHQWHNHSIQPFVT